MTERCYLTVAEVLQIHHQQIDNYGGTQGVRDRGLLESAVFRPQIGYFNTIAEEAAALMDVPRMRELMGKYADRPVDLADAALIRVAEREGIRKIFNVDREDFTVFRLHGRVRPKHHPPNCFSRGFRRSCPLGRPRVPTPVTHVGVRKAHHKILQRHWNLRSSRSGHGGYSLKQNAEKAKYP